MKIELENGSIIESFPGEKGAIRTNNNIVYIIPVEEDKPIKYIYNDEESWHIEENNKGEFEAVKRYKVDKDTLEELLRNLKSI